ncbi:MAG: family 78 glycoside hydrolase catalytic domain [Bacteroidales bacterium]|nr:family 78 glycoside hydrolase catalytic domain [Bacteroidales bacterium]
MSITNRFLALFLGLLLLSDHAAGQELPEPWVSYPTASVTDYGVYHFRKQFNIDNVPEKLIIHVSADNRYHLFINGERVCYGPAKGDLQTYKYDVVDIAPFLQTGSNLIAALVYNAGKDKPMALLSVQTAFMVRPEDNTYSELTTDGSWMTFKNPAFKPVSYYNMLFKERWFYGYYACGPGDDVDGTVYPWGWEQPGFNDNYWEHAEELSFDGKPPWNLVPRNIAFMNNHREYPKSIRKADGTIASNEFLQGKQPVIVPADSKVTILLDFEILTMGYPELTVNNGDGSNIKVKYAEALYEKVNLKAHRDSVEGKTMFGVWDVFRTDGAKRTFRPLWKRAFRYVQFEIETSDTPLEIVSYVNEYSGYPYPEMATFESEDDTLNMIFEMGLQTFRMCSGETYYDTPFYEQLSYGGDNRPIAAISTYNSTDDRLLREVMRLYPQSENRETGLFKSAYPSRFDFDMGSWSLAWIQSLHDYYFMRGDADYVKQFVDKIEGVLGFYHRHMDESKGILGTLKNQNFMDWSITRGSIPRSNENREIIHSTMLTLYYLHTLDCVMALYPEIGERDRIGKWKKEADLIRESVPVQCWDETRQLFSDHPGKDIYSQHSNLLAILTDVVPHGQQQAMMRRILEYDGFDEFASSYFSFFLFKALVKTDMENEFLKNLDFWYHFLERGHTTCGETGFASHDRSDCHAWAAHPSYYLLSIVCGIQPGDTGFKKILVEPHLGKLKNVKASMPHPSGRISVDYRVRGKNLQAKVILPADMEGTFNYGDQSISLKEGENHLKLPVLQQ